MTPIRLEDCGPLVLAGYLRRHVLSPDQREMCFRISTQWREFTERAPLLPALPPYLGYGVCLKIDTGAQYLDYFCGMVVTARDSVVAGFACLELPSLRCAIFEHHGNIAVLSYTLDAIFRAVLPGAGLVPAGGGAPNHIQRYFESFDPETGQGGFEVLVPVKEACGAVSHAPPH